MTPDEKAAWKRHLGIGERQPRDGVVADTTRTRTWRVTNQITGGTAGTQTEHRSGRVDGHAVAPHVHSVISHDT